MTAAPELLSRPKRVDPEKLSVAFREPELCARSGTCIGICPHDALSIGPDHYPRIDEDKCTECGLCRKVCPGEDVSFTRLNELSFGDSQVDEGFDGRVRETHVGYASSEAMRSGGAGGGVVTALLFDLLKHGDVDGCIVTRMRPDKPWLGESFIARTEEDLLASQGSRYSIIPFNAILREVRNSRERFAAAVLPCHLHGLRFAFAEVPELRERLPYIVGLFCGGALETYVVPELLQTKGIAPEEISDFQFRGGDWPGKMRAIMADDTVRDLHYSNYKDGAYNYFVGLYMPGRCQTCIDGSGLFSDISVSDAWTRDAEGKYKFPRQSRILVRNESGKTLVERAVERGTLVATNLGADKSYQTHRHQTRRKGINAPLRLARQARSGKPVPHYNVATPATTWYERMTERGVSALLWLGQYRWIRYPLVRFLTSRGALPLIWIRVWLKKHKYRRSR